MHSPFTDPEVVAWAQDIARRMVPAMASTEAVALIVPEEVSVPDVKLAVELGFALLLDKPLMLVVPPGREVPARLAAVADELIEWSDDPGVMGERVRAALERVSR